MACTNITNMIITHDLNRVNSKKSADRKEDTLENN
jgi:hypothetical protein